MIERAAVATPTTPSRLLGRGCVGSLCRRIKTCHFDFHGNDMTEAIRAVLTVAAGWVRHTPWGFGHGSHIAGTFQLKNVAHATRGA